MTYDAGILASDVYSIKKSKSEILGLGVMYVHTIDYNEQIKFWTNLINKLSENNIKWNIFTNGPKKDEEFAEHILELIGYDNKTINSLLIRNITSPNQLVKIISNFNSLISLRLHSHIVAYSLGIPTISIVWDNKVKLFFETIKYPSRCFDITSDTNQILNMLDSIIKEEYDQKIKTEQIKELEDILIMETVKQLRRR